MRSLVFLALSVATSIGCASRTPSEAYPTPALTYRDAALGGACAAAVAHESSLGGEKIHEQFDGLDQYGIVDSGNRIAVILCRDGVVCSQSITSFVDTPARANALCGELHETFVREMGQPYFDAQSDSFVPPPSYEEIVDPGVMRPTTWRLSHSELMLDCPLDPNGDGFWTVSTHHDTTPQLVTSEMEPGVVVVSPARACLTPEGARAAQQAAEPDVE